jgi:hypothetical protein
MNGGPRYRRVGDFSSHGRKSMKIDLSEKTAIVTGSTGGIGYGRAPSRKRPVVGQSLGKCHGDAGTNRRRNSDEKSLPLARHNANCLKAPVMPNRDVTGQASA